MIILGLGGCCRLLSLVKERMNIPPELQWTDIHCCHWSCQVRKCNENKIPIKSYFTEKKLHSNKTLICSESFISNLVDIHLKDGKQRLQAFLPLLMFEGKLAQQLPADLRGKQNKRLSRHRASIALNRRMHFLQTVALDCVEDQHIAKTRSIRRSFHRHHYIIGGTSLKVECCNSTPQARVVIGKVFADITTSLAEHL